MRKNVKKWLAVTFTIILAISVTLTGCGNSRKAEIAEKKKETYEKLKTVSMQATTELTYLLSAWDFTNNSPDFREYSKSQAFEALELISTYLNDYESKMSVFGITVTDDDVFAAMQSILGDHDSLYKDQNRSNGMDRDTIGAFLATDEEGSVGAAKYIFELKDPLGLGFDYKAMMEEISALLNSLGELVDDEEFQMLKEAYGEVETVVDDIDKAPDGSIDTYLDHLENCRDKTTPLEEIFGDV